MAEDNRNENYRPQHEHLWVPEGEIEHVDKTLIGRAKPRDVHHADHGERLLGAIKSIEEVHREKPSTLEDVVVFKMTLAEREKFQNRSHQDFLEANRIRLNAVRNERTAFVSMAQDDLNRLKGRLDQYRRYDRYKDFQYVETVESLNKEEKQSLELRRTLATGDLGDEALDVQIQLLPNLGGTTYGLVVARLNQIVREEGGEQAEEPFYMSNQTPVLRYYMPASAVDLVSEDDAVFRIEITPTYEFQMPEEAHLPPGPVTLDPNVVLEELPVVGVIDTGIELPGILSPLLVGEWSATGLTGANRAHGTMVASRVLFGPTLKAQVDAGMMTPRARVYSLHVSDGQRMKGTDLMRHIQQAVEALPPEVRIVNLSINQVNKTVEDDALSIFGNLLDILSITHGVSFVVSAGNQNVWVHAADLDDAFNQEESRITSPADAYLAITTGAAAYQLEGETLIVDFAPYTRRGPGFGGNKKVDLLAEGGGASIAHGKSVVTEPAWVIDHLGGIYPINGTSFAAPVVAGDLAEVREVVADKDLLLSRALLTHTAMPVYDMDSYDVETREFLQQIVGNGLSHPERAKLSSKSSVTFVARGTLNRRTKARVNFFVPSVLQAGNVRQPLVTVRVTCVSLPPLDYAKGQEYLGACVLASLKGFNSKGTMRAFNPAQSEGRAKWQPVQHFSTTTSAFATGTWQVWLELMTRWETKDDQEIPYALCITVEDPAHMLDVYSAIQVEAQNRFQPMTRTRVRG